MVSRCTEDYIPPLSFPLNEVFIIMNSCSVPRVSPFLQERMRKGSEKSHWKHSSHVIRPVFFGSVIFRPLLQERITLIELCHFSNEICNAISYKYTRCTFELSLIWTIVVSNVKSFSIIRLKYTNTFI